MQRILVEKPMSHLGEQPAIVPLIQLLVHDPEVLLPHLSTHSRNWSQKSISAQYQSRYTLCALLIDHVLSTTHYNHQPTGGKRGASNNELYPGAKQLYTTKHCVLYSEKEPLLPRGIPNCLSFPTRLYTYIQQETLSRAQQPVSSPITRLL